MPIEESPLDPTKRQKSSRHRILVVDDSNGVRQLKVDLLVGSGYDVEEARDGADGWEALQTGHYDLIITDNTMPRMTGVEMIEKFRFRKHDRNCPSSWRPVLCRYFCLLASHG